MTSKRFIGFFIAIGISAALVAFSGPFGCAKNCGNSVLDEGEACDDGNTADGDGCSSSCEIETGGGTTGGSTTGGGTTGGSSDGSCTTPADCPDSFTAPSVCYDPENCQGNRKEATCIDGECGFVLVPDDSACTAESFSVTCNNASGSCDGTVAQSAPVCSGEVCNDGDPTPGNDNVDDDGDGLINCADTLDCPNNTPCTRDTNGLAACWAGLCQD